MTTTTPGRCSYCVQMKSQRSRMPLAKQVRNRVTLDTAQSCQSGMNAASDTMGANQPEKCWFAEFQ